MNALKLYAASIAFGSIVGCSSLFAGEPNVTTVDVAPPKGIDRAFIIKCSGMDEGEAAQACVDYVNKACAKAGVQLLVPFGKDADHPNQLTAGVLCQLPITKSSTGSI